jgi:CDP-glucose 4,6-dehydratase
MSGDASPWHGRRVLVTGCTGLLGGAVARELLACGADVVALVRDNAAALAFRRELVDGRFHPVLGRAEDTFRLHSAIAVYEVAAVLHLAPVGTGAVLRAASLYSSRVPVVTARPIPQLALARPGELREGRLGVACFGEVFGPGDRKLTRIVPATATRLFNGEGLCPADSAARDFVFVRDAARACLRVAEDFAANGPGEHSFRSGWLLTDRQMGAATQAVAAGRAAELSESEPPTNPLGWQPRHSFAEAMAETLAWYREFLRAGAGTVRKVA